MAPSMNMGSAWFAAMMTRGAAEMKLNTGLAAVFAAALLLAACGAIPTGAIEARIGQPFEIEMGSSIRLEDDDAAVEVIFEEVDSDSRCPVDAECILAGSVTITVLASIEDGRYRRFDLSLGAGEAREQRALGAYTLRLVEVLPYPGEQGYGDGQFTATFMIEKP
jgi:hypothetical protein